MILRKPTIRDCLYFHEHPISNDDMDDMRIVQQLSNRFIVSDNLTYPVSRLPIDDYQRIRTALYIIYQTCNRLNKKQVYTIIFKLNGNTFNDYTSLLDTPIDDLGTMIDVVNEYIEAVNEARNLT